MYYVPIVDKARRTMPMSIVLWHLAPVGPYPVRTVYTKSRLSREQVVSRNAGFLDGFVRFARLATQVDWPLRKL